MSRRGWISLVLLLLTVAAYARIADNDFTWWDDAATIHHNPDFNPPTSATVLGYWKRPHMDLYVPVTYTVWGLLAAVGRLETPDAVGIQLNPAVFHVASILVHCAGMLLVFAILGHLVHSDWAAAAGALFFAWHPVQVEAVAWASGLKDMLAGMFSLLAVWQYLLFHAASGASPLGTEPPPQPAPGVPAEAVAQRPRLHYTLAMVAFVLAMLSKPSAMVVPLLVMVIDRLFLVQPWVSILRRLWPWLLLSAICAVLTKLVQPATLTSASPLWARPLIAADAVAFYLGKLLCPVHMGVDYGRYPAYVLSSGQAYFTWVLPAALAGLLIYYRTPLRPLAAGGLLLVGGVLPVLGLVQFDNQERSTVADHYLYLAMLGPAVMVAWLFARYAGSRAALTGGVIALVLACLTFIQGGHWQDDQALWQHALAVNPRSWTAAANLGAFLKNVRNQPDLAAAYLRQAIALKSDYAAAHDNLGNYLLQRRQYQAAIEQFRQVLRLSQDGSLDPVPTMNDLGVALTQVGQYQEAADMFRAALKRQPDHADAQINLGKVMELQANATSRPAGAKGQ